MSLLVDPDYAIHALRLAYLRRIDDTAGPRVITFPSIVNLPEGTAEESSRKAPVASQSSDGLAELAVGASPKPSNREFANTATLSPLPSHSPIVIAGLNDARYQPELTTLHSPNLNTLFALEQTAAKSDIFGGPSSRLGADAGGQYRRASEGRNGGGLKYTTTIMGPGRSGGLGMRVGGRRAVSRDGVRRGRASSKGDSLLEEGPEAETDNDIAMPNALIEGGETGQGQDNGESSGATLKTRNQRSSSVREVDERDLSIGSWPHPRNRSSSQPFQQAASSLSNHEVIAPNTPGLHHTQVIEEDQVQSIPLIATPPMRPPRAASRSLIGQSGPTQSVETSPRLQSTHQIQHRAPSSLASLHLRRRSASEGATDFLKKMSTIETVPDAETSKKTGSDIDSTEVHDEREERSMPATLGRMDSDSTIFSLASPVATRQRGLSDRSQGDSIGTALTASPFSAQRPSFSSYQLGKPSNLSPAISRTRVLDSSPLSKKTNIVGPDDEIHANIGHNETRGSEADVTDGLPGDVSFESVEGSSTYLAAADTSALGLHFNDKEDKPALIKPRLKLDVQLDDDDVSAPSSLGGQKRRIRPKASTSHMRAEHEAQQRQEFFRSLKTDSQTVASRFESRPRKSGISQLMSNHNDTPDNPFAAYYKGVGEGNVKFEMYFPFANEDSGDGNDAPKSSAKNLHPKTKSMSLSARKEATMEEVVGYGLYCYYEEGWSPRLDAKARDGATEEEREILLSTLGWTLRIVEDGEVDDDYPAIDRSLLVGRFGADELAICEATPAQIKQHIALQSTIKRRVTPQGKAVGSTAAANESQQQQGLAPPGPSAHLAATAGNVTAGSLINLGGTPIFASSVLSKSAMTPSSASIFLRILITPNSDVKYKTTLQVPSDMYLADVLETICRKRQLADIDMWAFVVAEKEIVVPLDRTVESLQGNHDLVLVKRQDLGDQADGGALTGQSTNPNASIFKRLSQPIMPSKYRGAEKMASTYKTYTVNRKQASFLGRHERTLTLDGEWVHIIPTDAKAFHSQSGTNSFPVTAIVTCAQSRVPSNFKLIIARENDQKRYEFEAESSKVAAEIVDEINTLMKRHR